MISCSGSLLGSERATAYLRRGLRRLKKRERVCVCVVGAELRRACLIPAKPASWISNNKEEKAEGPHSLGKMINDNDGLTDPSYISLYQSISHMAPTWNNRNEVSVAFHQVVRAMTPVFTIAISILFLGKRYTTLTYLSLMPLLLGVYMATVGDYSYTAMGFFLTVLGTVLAAVKTVVTNRIQMGRLQLHPLDLLLRMSPLAFVQTVIFSWMKGELDEVVSFCKTEMSASLIVALLINGIIAFFLNFVSFTANKKTSALTMTVAGNLFLCGLLGNISSGKRAKELYLLDLPLTYPYMFHWSNSQRQAGVVDRGCRDSVQHEDWIPQRTRNYHDPLWRCMLQLCGFPREGSEDETPNSSIPPGLIKQRTNTDGEGERGVAEHQDIEPVNGEKKMEALHWGYQGRILDPNGNQDTLFFAVLFLFFLLFSWIPFLHHEKLDLVHDFVFALHSILLSSFTNLV